MEEAIAEEPRSFASSNKEEEKIDRASGHKVVALEEEIGSRGEGLGSSTDECHRQFDEIVNDFEKSSGVSSEGVDDGKGVEGISPQRSCKSEIPAEFPEMDATGADGGLPGSNDSNGKIDSNGMSSGGDKLLHPHFLLPQPVAPLGITKSASVGEVCNAIDKSASSPGSLSIGKFLRDRSSSISSSIIKRVSSLREHEDDVGDLKMRTPTRSTASEINLHGLTVIVQLKEEQQNRYQNLNGQISFFSRSNCRDCTAVRSFFRERDLRFVEINLDVYPEREKELIERAGSSSVPQIFFNEKLVGGLVVLNSLRNSGELDGRMKELLRKICPKSAPAVPVYGFGDREEDEAIDETIGIVKVLRQRLPIQDRIARMKMVRNCFAGKDMVEVLIQHLDCGRKKAVEVGQVIANKHFIHHVFREYNFEDGNHLYRFLEHEPTIPRCFNFQGATNDSEPKPALIIGRRLMKIMSAILEAYASEDRCCVDYSRISKSEEFRRYVNLVHELQRVDILALSPNEKLAFFLNLYNAMTIHAVIRIGWKEGVLDRRTFYGDFYYIVGGFPYSLNTIKHGILRSNQREPYSLVKPFAIGDMRIEVAIPKVNPLIHFGLCNGSRSSPTVRFFSAEGVETELKVAAREFLLAGGMEVNIEKRTISLARIFKWYSVDFGQEKDLLKWMLKYLDATKAGLLTHLLSDGGPINFVFQKHVWSLNSFNA